MKEKPLSLQQRQLEKLKELGAYLRQVRQEKSLPLEDVASKTRISARLLRAIEQGKLEQLPEPVYIQGFIRRFADVLGMDGEEFASDFPTGVGFFRINYSWRDLPAAQLRPIHLYLLYILLVIAAVQGLSYIINRSAVQAQQESRQSNPPSATQITFEAKNSSSAVKLERQPSTPNQSVKVGVTLKEQSWIKVVADGKTEFEGVLKEGEQRTWVAKEKLIVRAGNAGGVLVVFNDQKAKTLGDPGQVQEVTFQANRRS